MEVGSLRDTEDSSTLHSDDTKREGLVLVHTASSMMDTLEGGREGGRGREREREREREHERANQIRKVHVHTCIVIHTHVACPITAVINQEGRNQIATCTCT